MKNIPATISTMAVGCFLLSSLCQGAEESRQKERLETAWQNMTSGEPVLTSQLEVWNLDNPGVSEFVSGNYSAKDVVVRLPEDSLRNKGNIEWVLLKRKDHMQRAEALRELSKDKRAYVQIAVIELSGELIHSWGAEDATSTQEVTGLLKEISKNTSLSWGGVSLRAQQAIDQVSDTVEK